MEEIERECSELRKNNIELEQSRNLSVIGEEAANWGQSEDLQSIQSSRDELQRRLEECEQARARDARANEARISDLFHG